MTSPTILESQSKEPDSSARTFNSYIPPHVQPPEFTFSALLVGVVLGIIFGASSLYLVLKVGLTVSASIPVAVLSITLFRVFAKLGIIRRASILENNIVQTTGSAGESIAFGVGVTMPALMLLGFEMDIGRVMVVSILGGLLGILMMIPLRRAFIVKQHATLKYPEGTACAEVLIVGEQGGTSARTVFAGFGIAFFYQFLWQGFNLWKSVASQSLNWFRGASPAIEVNPALLGVGYIIGTRISCVMVAGGVLASFVLIPAIRLFGDGLLQPVYPGKVLISQMDEELLWHDYILYIGAGAVAAGGIISLFQALPLIIGSLRAGLRDIGFSQSESAKDRILRTDKDLPLWVVGAGSVLLVFAIWLTTPLHQVFSWVPNLHMNPLGALLIVLFGFLFVTVSSRLTGEIGSSSNPISGMTVATLLLTCLIFLVLGWDRLEDRLTALSVAAVVCIAASNGGTTSQDLKTGYLVGATPKWQQLAIGIGALSSALVIGVILVLLNNAYTIYTTQDLPILEQPLDITRFVEREKVPGEDTEYYVWRATDGNEFGIPQGKYLIDEQGRIRFLVDPGINGKRSRRDDGTEVTRFKAPKAVLMAFITNGILQRNLPWSLVLLGVSLAIVLELCGVPSLPFAVGVYLPLSASTPIFAGGMARYIVEWSNRHKGGVLLSETDSDMSPGVLLSTGYIAGSTIAGVVIAFLALGSDQIPKLMNAWQFRLYNVRDTRPFNELIREVARDELRLSDRDVPENRRKEFEDFMAQIDELNRGDLARYVVINRGSVLRLPGNKSYPVENSALLGEIAQNQLGTAERAQLLLDLNRVPSEYIGTLAISLACPLPGGLPWSALYLTTQKGLPASTLVHLPEDLPIPAGASLKIPQSNLPALLAFAALSFLLIFVGVNRKAKLFDSRIIEP